MIAVRASVSLLMFPLAALGVAACAADAGRPTQPPPTSPPVVEPSPPATASVTWETCSFRTGGNDARAECADIEVPLDWTQPDGRKITYFVKRLLGTAPGPRTQLWLLQGGPGGAGDGLESMAAAVAPNAPTFDLYIPDHRGTGRSAYLGCPDTLASGAFDYGDCAAEAQREWGADGLATFTTTSAARDLGYAIEHTRAPGQDVHVYGVSYGTYLAQRYLQIFPSQPTAVTLDSVCQAGLCSYMKIGYWFDRVGKKYLGECAADTFCASKLGPDPVATVRQALAIADAGTCAGIANIDASALRRLFSYLITSFELRVLIPSISYRVVRCDVDDVAALKTMVTTVSKAFGGFGGFRGFAPQRNLSSDVLGFHIAFSEMEESPPTPRAELEKLLEGAVFTTPDPTIREAYDAWPRYAHDELVGKYPSSRVPVLLLNGTLDPQTPQEFAEQVAPHYASPSQTLVLLPRAAHGTIYQSPTASNEACGMTIWRQFLTAPTAALDTPCRAEILGHDFAGSTAVAEHFFGKPSLWGGPPGAGSLVAPPPRSVAAGGASAIDAELQRVKLSVGPWLDRSARFGQKLMPNEMLAP